MPAAIDPKIRELAERTLAGKASKRAKSVIRALLERGSMSTDELAALGYEHPPRAVRDVKDAGIPIVATMVRSERTQRPMAVYSFGNADAIQGRASGGRRQFPKWLKQSLIREHGSQDRITGAEVDPKTLQIDHRIPYTVAGDADELVTSDYMLLDASSQRAKSWACEHCPNILPDAQDPAVCGTCFWACPEGYEHVATEQVRRTDVVWQGDDVEVHDRLKSVADARGDTMAEAVRAIIRQIGKTS